MRFSKLFDSVRRHPDWPPLRGLMLLILAAYTPSLIGVGFGAWPFAEDAPALFGPWRQFARDNLLAGRLPLWNPHLFCGLPFLSNGQSSVLYAPNLIHLVLPLKAALWSDAFAHGLLLGVGGYVLGRALKLGRSSSLLAGLCLGLAGPVSAHLFAGHMTWHAARAWIPWQMAALWMLLRSGRGRFAVALSVFFALQMYAGYPPLVGLSAGLCLVLLLIFGLARLRDQDALIIPPRRLAMLGALSIGLIVLLSAAIIGPLREVSAQSVHGSGLSWDEATRLSGGPRTLLRVLLPGFFGGNGRQQWSLKFGSHEEASSIGLLSLLLALSAPCLLWQRRQTSPSARFFGIFAPALMLLSALLAFGANAPFYGILFEHLPPFQLLRIPVRWMELWYFAAALLAGFGLDVLLRARQSTLTRIFTLLRLSLATVGVLMLFIGVLSWWRTADESVWPRLSALVAQTPAGERQSTLIAYFRWVMLGESVWGGALALSGWWMLRRCGPDRRRLCHVVIILVAVDLMALFWRDTRLVPSSSPPRSSIQWPPLLTARFTPGQRWTTALDWRALNGAMTRNVDLFGGYDAMNGRRFWQLADAVEGRESWTDIYQPTRPSPLLRVAGVGAELRLKKIKLSSLEADARLISSQDQWQLWHRPGAWPRAYIADQVVRHAPNQQIEILQTLAEKSYPHGRYPVVVAPDALRDYAPETSATSAETRHTPSKVPPKVLWQRASVNRFSAQVRTARPSIVVCSEAWSEGWRAWVNNREVEVAPANVLFRALPVPRGASRVEMVYEPPSLRSSLFWSLCGLSVLSALAMMRTGKR